jgi:hypothetical protein
MKAPVKIDSRVLLEGILVILIPMLYHYPMSGSEDKETAETISSRERIAWHPAFFEAIQMELDESVSTLNSSRNSRLRPILYG